MLPFDGKALHAAIAIEREATATLRAENEQLRAEHTALLAAMRNADGLAKTAYGCLADAQPAEGDDDISAAMDALDLVRDALDTSLAWEAERPADWSATWRDDATGAGMTRDDAIRALADLSQEHTALVRHLDRLRETGLAMFPANAWLRVEGPTIVLNRAATEAFSVALAATPAPVAPIPAPEPGIDPAFGAAFDEVHR